VVVALPLADGSVAGCVTVTDVDVLSAGGVVLLAIGAGVMVLGVVTTVVESRAAVGSGTVVEVVVVRSQAASETPSARAATRGISFMCSPYGSCEATS
jgi:hypothetical protein